MMSFKNLKIGSKILVGNVILIVLIAITALIGTYELNSAATDFEDLYLNRVQPLEQLDTVMRDVQQVRVSMLVLAIALEAKDMDVVRKRQDQMDELHKEWKDVWAAYRATKLVEEEERLVAICEAAEAKMKPKYERFRQAALDGDAAGVARYAEEWAVEYRPLRDALTELVKVQVVESKHLYDEVEASFRRSLLLNALLFAAALAVAITLLVLMRRYVTRPLENAVERMKDLAEGEGDLTKRLEVNSADEVGDMSKWINQFIENIHKIVQEMAVNTNQVKGSSGQLAGASQNLSAGMEEMTTQSRNISAAATQMNQNFQVISSSVEEMSTSVGEVARNASDASKIAREADRTATETNAKIKQLGVDAQEIGKVVESIQGIASQTNLLALNAAIEAAGAGEAGKGFAVVASEVKELARQAAEASDEIKKRIEAIQSSADIAVDSIAAIADVISKINEFSASIASSVEEQSITAKEIAGNVNQSAQASNDVVQNIAGISQATQDGAKNAQSMSDLAGQLDGLSASLEQIVRRFKI